MNRLLLLFTVVVAGCARPAAPKPSAAIQLESGIRFTQVQLDPEHRLWIYEPTTKRTRPRALVLVAPAGAHGFDGMTLGDGDRPEQLPYVRAGYVVVAYDISGPLERHTRRGVAEAAAAFREAEFGVADARRALEYARAHLDVDPNRVIVAGHSSAATLALLNAESLPDIAACLAYAPVVDETRQMSEKAKAMLQRDAPETLAALAQSNPLILRSHLRCPTFVFHAQDDSIVPREPLATFAHGQPVEWREVSLGDHYDSMIQQGIPMGLAFLRAHNLAP